jgi:DNA-binding LacI/PurR family transcriptional regulator
LHAVTGPRKRVTQQDIARMTGVSQATVSLVLNARDDMNVRIAPETRERVLRVIEETGYVADPIARRLQSRHARIIGVFTYEPLFPTGSTDFFRPFLAGIEEQAERVGCDLLLLTSAAVVGGRRRIFGQDSRLRLADGCILLGGTLDTHEAARLLRDGPPFVSVGRRDNAGGPIPYVGAAYADAVAALVQRAADLGHRRAAYLGKGEGPESYVDRMTGFERAVAATGIAGHHVPVAHRALDSVLAELHETGVTAVFVEDHADGVALAQYATEQGIAIPNELSVVTLGQPTRPTPSPALVFSGLELPRRRMGVEALEVLYALLTGAPTEKQRLLPCELVEGASLVPPRR